jgi:hypothetical protein
MPILRPIAAVAAGRSGNSEFDDIVVVRPVGATGIHSAACQHAAFDVSAALDTSARVHAAAGVAAGG